jgi:hypothetical protein
MRPDAFPVAFQYLPCSLFADLIGCVFFFRLQRQTVSIRGTKNLITLLTNFKARPTEFLQGAKVHQGYLKVAQGLQKWITPHLR